jgi:hypothetical protein
MFSIAALSNQANTMRCVIVGCAFTTGITSSTCLTLLGFFTLARFVVLITYPSKYLTKRSRYQRLVE